MVWYKKNISAFILFIMLVMNVTNRFIVDDFEIQWAITMNGLAAMLALYSFYAYNRRKTKANLFIFIIFASEMVATILGWNLNTHYYPEFIIFLIIVAIYYCFKKWRRA